MQLITWKIHVHIDSIIISHWHPINSLILLVSFLSGAFLGLFLAICALQMFLCLVIHSLFIHVCTCSVWAQGAKTCRACVYMYMCVCVCVLACLQGNIREEHVGLLAVIYKRSTVALQWTKL